MEKKTFEQKLGTFIGKVITTCFTICISAIMIALTARFLIWLF